VSETTGGEEMTMTPEQKRWIDNASYESLLSRWRNSPAGDQMFQGEAGEYYSRVMAEKRAADPSGHVRASKSIGWGGSSPGTSCTERGEHVLDRYHGSAADLEDQFGPSEDEGY
jgi:hypothetical protein